MDVKTLARIATFLAEQMNLSRHKRKAVAQIAIQRWMTSVTLLAVALEVDEEKLAQALNEVNDWTNKTHIEASEVLSLLVLMQAGMFVLADDEDEDSAAS